MDYPNMKDLSFTANDGIGILLQNSNHNQVYYNLLGVNKKGGIRVEDSQADAGNDAPALDLEGNYVGFALFPGESFSGSSNEFDVVVDKNETAGTGSNFTVAVMLPQPATRSMDMTRDS